MHFSYSGGELFYIYGKNVRNIVMEYIGYGIHLGLYLTIVKHFLAIVISSSNILQSQNFYSNSAGASP